MQRSIMERSTLDLAERQIAQFQLPQAPPGGGAPQTQMPKRLTYQYSWSTESTATYRRDPDLDRRVRDNSNIMAPNLNGYVTYRPTDRLEGTLEMVFEREIPLHEESTVILPNGETRVAQKRHNSLVVDQAFVVIKNFIAPFELMVGRRNFEDERRSLYDTSIDMVGLVLRKPSFRGEAFVGREHRFDWELAPGMREEKDNINTYSIYAEYRGLEDLKLAGFGIARIDATRQDGSPKILGARVLGTPSAALNYWTEVALSRGSDQLNHGYRGRAYDAGLTYRFARVPFSPNITLGYAYGSGDADPDDNKNTEFRPSGLQSDERRFAGVSQFKVYGEALDPPLSNIKIFTLGIGFRPAPNASLDLVYHRYRTDKIADEIHNWGLTAQMAQVDTHLSKEVGSGLDIVLGLRNLFGVRRLGLDLRAGWFFPGKAFVRNEGDDVNPVIRNADTSIAVVAKLWF